jgi:glycosyltransferase involved in cell wall biosynthesis
MRVAHVLRKLDPAQWSGTEMAIQRLLEGLRRHQVDSTVYCPQLEGRLEEDPLVRCGFEVQRYRAFVPVLGLAPERRRQLVSVGGNLMSFGLIRSLWRRRGLSVIHAHTLGRIGGIALTVARRRRIPFVLTIHGGVLDLPDKIKQSFNSGAGEGWEWGKFFGLVFQSHRLFRDANAILTCNGKEAALLQRQFPQKKIVVQPHGVPIELYRADRRAAAWEAYPEIKDRPMFVCLGRIDPVKNQLWLIEQMPSILRRHPDALLVLAGPCTDEVYGRQVEKRIGELGLHVLRTGPLPPNDPRAVGLLQCSRALILPSLSETFGLVILEAWAAGTMVLSANASGPAALIQHGENGWLFDLNAPETFHSALDRTLADPVAARQMVQRGARVTERFSTVTLAGRLKKLYEHLIEEKQCVM